MLVTILYYWGDEGTRTGDVESVVDLLTGDVGGAFG